MLGLPDERALAQPIFDRLTKHQALDLMKCTDLLQAAAILWRCAPYIGNDNAQTYLYAAIGTRIVGLFGSTPTSIYRPWGRGVALSVRKRRRWNCQQIRRKLMGMSFV